MEILFVCTGNICRSPMAEGLLRHMLARRSLSGVQIRSAGIHALDGRPAEPHAVEAARELGADITGHTARSLDREMVERADMILVMERGQAELIARVLPRATQKEKLRLLAAGSAESGSPEVDDPYGMSLDAYRTCAHVIRRCLTAVLEQIEDMGTRP
ncbi:MAG: low molecular weight protein arginine phosphatase [Desulfosarcina sp.]|nr:low molecular weight protein arginine phosphatase [Desulfobacterales bacterium]